MADILYNKLVKAYFSAEKRTFLSIAVGKLKSALVTHSIEAIVPGVHRFLRNLELHITLPYLSNPKFGCIC